jgi:hypothetical protein
MGLEIPDKRREKPQAVSSRIRLPDWTKGIAGPWDSPISTAELADLLQYFVMCLNAEITEVGKATPKGVKFPGAYKSADPGIRFNLRTKLST